MIKFLLLFCLILSPLFFAVAQTDPELFATPESRATSNIDYQGPFIDEETQLRFQEEKDREWVDKGNDGPAPPALIPWDPNWVEDEFEIPPEEALVGCIYARGYSFPSVCVDETGRKIFDIEKDTPEVLAEILVKQGKKGKYNIIPEGHLSAIKKRLGDVEIVDPEVPVSTSPQGTALND